MNILKKDWNKRFGGEIKWTGLSSSYLNKYKEIIGLYLNHSDTTFHSWTYKHASRQELIDFWDNDKNKMFYSQAYFLLRNVIRKCLNHGCNNNFYIVPDTTGARGRVEYVLTRNYLTRGSSIRPRPLIEFCDQGNSQICGALQVADVCTGATRYKYQPRSDDNPVSSQLVDFLEDLNGDIPLNYADEKLPNLYKYKMHHCLYKK